MERDLTTAFATVEEAIDDYCAGRFVVVVDAADRENEGDLTIAAQFATSEAINFMATHARGLICLCLTEERCDELSLHAMTPRNEAPLQTAFTVSVEAREGVTTGISAADRSRTIQVAIDPSKTRNDLVSPGHTFPLRARDGGVLRRAGQTEAAVDLARLAGLNPAGVVCEIMNEDGTMARVGDLVPFCEKHGLKMITVADLIEYRRRNEKLVERMTSVRLPTVYGEFTAVAFRETLTSKHHVALVKGEVDGHEDVLVRVHSECLTGDVFHSLRCDCGEQLEWAMSRIGAEEHGVLLYMSQEGRNIGLLNKLRAYELQEQRGLDTVEANLELGFPEDAREWGIGYQVLADLGLSTIRILTNNPRKIAGLEGYGLRIVEQVPIEVPPNDENRHYLATKRRKLGHRLHHQDLRFEAELDGMSGLFDRERLTEVEVPVTPAPIPRREPPPPVPTTPSPQPDDAPQEVAEAEAAEQPAEEAPPQHADSGFRIPEGCTVLEGIPEGEGRTVGIVVSRFNGEITTPMLEHALAELDRLGVARSSITVMPVPGAFELPLAAMALAKTRRCSCVVALGCVIRGDTPHFDFVAGEAASGIQLAAIETGVPVAFGVLTTETREQAEARIGRAADAARGALEMAHLFSQLRARAAATA